MIEISVKFDIEIKYNGDHQKEIEDKITQAILKVILDHNKKNELQDQELNKRPIKHICTLDKCECTGEPSNICINAKPVYERTFIESVIKTQS